MPSPLRRYERSYDLLLSRYLLGPLAKYRDIAGLRLDADGVFHLVLPNRHGDLVLYSCPHLDGRIVRENRIPGQRISLRVAVNRDGWDVAVWVERILLENQFAASEITLSS
jgi:hypothetical protein